MRHGTTAGVIFGVAIATISVASPALALAATATGVLITTVTASNLDPAGKVPTINGVAGAAVNNIDLAVPQAILVHGTTYFYGMTTQNNTFSGVCKDSFKLTQLQGSTTVVLDSGVIKSFDCTPGSPWFWVKTGKPVPNAPGPANLIGTVTYGGSKVTMNVKVLIQ